MLHWKYRALLVLLLYVYFNDYIKATNIRDSLNSCTEPLRWSLGRVCEGRMCVSPVHPLLAVPWPLSSCTSSEANRKLHLLPFSLTCLSALKRKKKKKEEKMVDQGNTVAPSAHTEWHCSLHWRREDKMWDKGCSSWVVCFVFFFCFYF